MTKQSIAVVGPMNAQRLIPALDLVPHESAEVAAVGHGGHPVTELVLAMQRTVERLVLVTLQPGLRSPLVYENGAGVRLHIGPYRERARDRARDFFRTERAYIEQVLSMERPRSVSAHWTYEYALGALQADPRTLVTVHDWAPEILRFAPDPYRACRLAMQGWAFAKGRHFAGVSPYITHRVQRYARRSCVLLPNGLADEWFLAQPAERRADSLRFVAVNSGFDARKNVGTLLEAWRLVQQVSPQAQLLLVGEGYEPTGAAQRWAAQRRLTQQVEFHGPVDRRGLAALLSTATAFVHPSREESFGMVILEAMAQRVPVIAGADSGAVPWLLRNGAGLLTDVRSPAALASSILAVADSPELRAGLRDRASRRAREFSISTVADDYLQHLRLIRDGS
ncbi:glycosyltransferase family 4 protein [Egicoccus halophilus]|uniref:Glycosyl transferase family 1 domain-containing protein n=1 Tax=Egicoccus halophilus TaxID=1670830 RepID=A0A8J3A7B5_9ACTN|nr:glycosyltransferase [Egicoccus halophilus]GGI05398.1 hypothetical protein GCM10011354_13900 [Egicoccus halophilus]